MTSTQTRDVAVADFPQLTTAVQKARALRKRLALAGASVSDVALLAGLFDVYERLERLERMATQGRGKRDAGD